MPNPLFDVGTVRVSELAKSGLDQAASDAGKSLYAFLNELVETAGRRLAKKPTKS